MGTQFIFRRLKVSTYLNQNAFFDVLERSKEFKHISEGFSKTVFKYENGKLFAVSMANGKLSEKEIMYAHFQKRKMNYLAFSENLDGFYIIPNKLISLEKVKSETALFNCKGKRVYKLKKKIEHVKAYLKRYLNGNYKSFKAYRKERSAFREDMLNAKRELKEWEN